MKEALAKPADKAAHQKLNASLATARAQLAGATAALTPAHVQPVDNVHSIAQSLKKDIADLKAAVQSSNSKAAAEVVTATKRGAFAQQLELAKAYPSLPLTFVVLNCFFDVRSYAANIKDPEQAFAVREALAELESIFVHKFYAWLMN